MKAFTRTEIEVPKQTIKKASGRRSIPPSVVADAGSLKPHRRHDRRRLRTREALLQAASEIFQERGVDQATVAEIADRADVAYGSLYNYFTGLEEMIAVLARQSIQRMLDETQAIMVEVSEPRLLPCVAARVILRTFSRDVMIKWMLDRPYVFASTFEQVASPYMRQVESRGIEIGALKPAGGHDVWIRTLPWILISELSRSIKDKPQNALAHEEAFARVCMRLLGINDQDGENLLSVSLKLVKKRGF